MNATVSATPWLIPADTIHPATTGAIRLAPKAAEMNPASVTPTWTAARNRFGWSMRVRNRGPRRGSDSTSRLIWLSRSETSAVSDAAKNPPISVKTRMIAKVAPNSPTMLGNVPHEALTSSGIGRPGAVTGARSRGL